MSNPTALLLILAAFHPARADDAIRAVRIGYFPNVTHAPALVALSENRFQKALGDRVKLETIAFNAGPSAVEALFAESIDFAFIGPNPAINAFIKSKGRVRIIAGVCSGGARLLVRRDAGIKAPGDFAGKKLATPQLGNTQDVAARNWLAAQGLKTLEKGGTVQVLPISNPDQLTLMIKKEIDAVWTVEPWASRLEHEANAVTFLDESVLWPDGKYATTVLVVSAKFLKANPDLVQLLLAEHIATLQWMASHRSEAKAIVNRQLAKLLGKPLSSQVIDGAFKHLEFTFDPLASSLVKSAQAAFDQGFLGRVVPVLEGLVDLNKLNGALAQKKLPLLNEGSTNASATDRRTR